MSSRAWTAERRYEEPRAHAVRERYLGIFGGEELPVPVEAIAEDLLGLRVEERWDIAVSGMLLPAERRIVLNAAEAPRDEAPLRRFRFTIVRFAGRSIPEQSISHDCSMRRPSRSSAIDSTGTGSSSLPKMPRYRSRTASARGSSYLRSAVHAPDDISACLNLLDWSGKVIKPVGSRRVVRRFLLSETATFAATLAAAL